MPRRKLVAVTAAVLVGAGASWGLRDTLGLSFDPTSLRETIESFGIWAPVFFVAIVTFRALLGLPSQLLLIGAGLAFGTLLGTVYGAAGLTLSGILYFTGARWAGREAVERRVPPRMRPAFEAAGTRLGAAVLAAGTGYPFGPITAYHTLAGLTGMAVPAFVLALVCGSAIRALLYTFFGSSLMAGSPEAAVLAGSVLALAFVVPLCFPRSRRWVRQIYAPSSLRAGRSAPSPPGTTRSDPG